MSFLQVAGWFGLASQGPRVGAIDVVAVRREDKSIYCGPFHVRVNKGNIKSDRRVVHLKVNGKDANISMKLGAAGEAFFIERTREKVLKAYRTSPITSPVMSPTNIPSPDPMNDIPNFSLPQAESNSFIISNNIIPIDNVFNNHDEIVEHNRDRSYSADDILQKEKDSGTAIRFQSSDEIIIEEQFTNPRMDESHNSLTEVVLDESRRLRSISDMSGLISANNSFLDKYIQPISLSSAVSSAMGSIDDQHSIPIPIPISNENTLKNDLEGRTLSHSIPLSNTPERNQVASSWTWTWGEIPIKAKAKSSADLYTQSLTDYPKAETKDKDNNSISNNNNNNNNNNNSSNNSNNQSQRNVISSGKSSSVIDSTNITFPSFDRMEYRAETSSPYNYIHKSRSDGGSLSSILHESSFSNNSILNDDSRPPSVAFPKSNSTSNRNSPSKRQYSNYEEEREVPSQIYEKSNVFSSLSFDIRSDVRSEIRPVQSPHENLSQNYSLIIENPGITSLQPLKIDKSTELYIQRGEKDKENERNSKDIINQTQSPMSPIFTVGMDLEENQFYSTNIHSIHSIDPIDSQENVLKMTLNDKMLVIRNPNVKDIEEMTIPVDIPTQFNINYDNNSSNNNNNSIDMEEKTNAKITENLSTESINKSETEGKKLNVIPVSKDFIVPTTSITIAITSTTTTTATITTASTTSTSTTSTMEEMIGNNIMTMKTSDTNESISYAEHQYNPSAFLQESEEVLPIHDEGRTDGGDFLSLQDIPLEEISPGPAGGDLYESDTDSYHSLSQDESEMNNKGFVRPKRYRYRKILVPSRDQIQNLSNLLVDGKNEISYEVDGISAIKSELFVWPEDAKIVVIDVEGAITSNRKGSVWASFLGGSKNAIHDGVATLLNNISSNGYHILYIAQNAASTKDQLEKMVAGTGSKLPPGPVIHSPECLMSGNATTTTRADIFKAAVLRGLKSLFPTHINPYYACFGTKSSDMIAFSRAGVPDGRMFIVDQVTGELQSMNRTLKRSFEEINKFLNEMFPPIADAEARRKSYRIHSTIIEDTYVDFNYWRLPPPDLIVD